MNPKTLELYNKALVAAGKEKKFNATNIDIAEKFAELIVEECIKVSLDERIEQKDIDDEYDKEIREYLCGNNSGIVDAVIAIRKHFGVE